MRVCVRPCAYLLLCVGAHVRVRAHFRQGGRRCALLYAWLARSRAQLPASASVRACLRVSLDAREPVCVSSMVAVGMQAPAQQVSEGRAVLRRREEQVPLAACADGKHSSFRAGDDW
eukprot:6173595-Pleurochrysis_carterae.AAC.1